MVGCLIWVIKICKFLTYNLIWLINDIIDNNYKLLLLWYSVYYAGDGLDRSSVNSTLWTCRSARQRNYSSGGQDRVCFRRVSCGSVPCCKHLALKATLWTCSSARLWHWTVDRAAGQRDGTDRVARGVHPLTAPNSDVFVLYLNSPSSCVSPPRCF